MITRIHPPSAKPLRDAIRAPLLVPVYSRSNTLSLSSHSMENLNLAGHYSDAEAIYRASQEELYWMMELSAQIPWTSDADGRILRFGHKWAELTGLANEQAADDSWAESLHQEDRSRVAAAWSVALDSGKPFDIEHRTRTAAGSYCWMRSRASPRHDKAGQIVKWYGTTEDISARKRTEDALRQSQKLAAVAQLASSISHEINNPLEAVTNLLYLAQNPEADLDEVRRLVASAQEHLALVAHTTTQTLRFYKKATNRQEITCDELLKSCLLILNVRLANRGIRVETRCRAARSFVCFDNEIRQVLANLVINSIDASLPCGGRLLIRSREGTNWRRNRKGIILTVADNGSGMSDEIRKQIYEPFFTTKEITGTGLGLWVSCEIVTRHEGVLRVRSSECAGRTGTVFTIFLPFDSTPPPLPTGANI